MKGETMSFAEYKPFLGLLIFGNIENLVLAAQGVIEGTVFPIWIDKDIF